MGFLGKRQYMNFMLEKGARKHGHMYSEAFMLMKYRTEDGTEKELIWNSRDGITPLTVHSKTGKLMTHVEWEKDEYLPTYQPKPGDRMFVTLTPESARKYAEQMVERWWDSPDFHTSNGNKYETKEEAIKDATSDLLKQWDGNPPDIITVE